MERIAQKYYQNLIFEFRGYKVILDFHLAKLYGTETKRLKEAVRRHKNRFPEDFMFDLTKEEFDILRSQIATSNRGGTRYPPMAFTEQGVAMLSSVLNSEKAVEINIEIMRAFVRYRALLDENQSVRTEIQQLDNKINKIFEYLQDKIELLEGKKYIVSGKRRKIGYKNYD